jgi:plastocyanin
VPTVTVSRNTRVKWLWRGNALHNVTVLRGPVKFHSISMQTGSYSKRMTRAGTYKIYCTIHGAADQSMTLKVK